MSTSGDRWLRVSAAAQHLQIHRDTVVRNAEAWGIQVRTLPGPRRERRYREADVLRIAEAIARGEFDAVSDELTPQQAADLLGVSSATVRRWEDRGIIAPTRRLPGSSHRRYSRTEVERLRDNPPAE